jgi:hypothetical protein
VERPGTVVIPGGGKSIALHKYPHQHHIRPPHHRLPRYCAVYAPFGRNFRQVRGFSELDLKLQSKRLSRRQFPVGRSRRKGTVRMFCIFVPRYILGSSIFNRTANLPFLECDIFISLHLPLSVSRHGLSAL